MNEMENLSLNPWPDHALRRGPTGQLLLDDHFLNYVLIE